MHSIFKQEENGPRSLSISNKKDDGRRLALRSKKFMRMEGEEENLDHSSTFSWIADHLLDNRYQTRIRYIFVIGYVGAIITFLPAFCRSVVSDTICFPKRISAVL